MAKLNDLPNELIQSIFFFCNSLQTAASLSTVCKRFQVIWIADKNEIVYTIYSHTLPAFPQAIMLAYAEQLKTHSIEEVNEMSPSSRTDLIVPLLLRNAQIGRRLYKMKWKKRAEERSKKLSTFEGFVKCFYITCRMLVQDHGVQSGSMRDLPSFAKLNSVLPSETRDIKDVLLRLKNRYLNVSKGDVIEAWKRVEDSPVWLSKTAIDRILPICSYFLRE